MEAYISGVIGEFALVDVGLPVRRWDDRSQRLQGTRLAAAVHAQESRPLLTSNSEVETFNDFFPIVVRVQVVYH